MLRHISTPQSQPQPATHALHAAGLDDHDLGLQHDLATLCAQQASRRHALRWLGAGASLAMAGAAGAAGTCSLIPSETAGPFPGDGSNSAAGGIANALTLSGIVRSDIRGSVGSAAGTANSTAPGLPLQMRLELVSASASCTPLAGYAIYLWHCTRDGLYSMYSSGVTQQNYLRGVQVTDADGAVTFQTIFPGCYSGRMPHMHVEVYRNLASATSYANKLRTTQIAFPVSLCQTVYRETRGYLSSVGNLASMSFATDMVFSDGYETQLAALGADRTAGVGATLRIAI